MPKKTVKTTTGDLLAMPVKITTRHPHGPHHELWGFPGDYPHLPGEHGMPEDPDDIVDFTTESICGGMNDAQDVESYDGTLGVTQQFVADHQRAVGQLQWKADLAARYDDPGNVANIRWCSGTLISCDLFLTAGHCFDRNANGWSLPKDNTTGQVLTNAQLAREMKVNFNYQRDPSGNLRTSQSFDVVDLVEYRLGGLDFAVVRLAGSPGRGFGFTRISTTDAAVGDMLAIIGHPAGVPKQIEAGPCTDLHDDRIGYDSLDTLGGSSGSGILGPNGTIVGVHTNGGCGPGGGHNHGYRISSILAVSPTVSNLAANKTVVTDLCRFKLKFVDDNGGVIKPVWRDGIKGVLDKRLGDVKTVAYDVGRPLDPGLVINPAVDPAGMGGGVPFVLATPHHSPTMAAAAGLAHGGTTATAGGAAQVLAELGSHLQAMAAQIAALQQTFDQVIAELEGRAS